MDCLIKGKPFYCREWAFAKIAHCLESRPSSKTCGVLVTGGAGCGKTAVFSELVWPTRNHARQKSLNRRVLAYHFCQSHESRSLSVTTFILSVVHQLANCEDLPGYAEKLKEPEIQAALEVREVDRNPDEAFRKAVLIPLMELEAPVSSSSTSQDQRPATKCFCIVVDSVDETGPHGAASSAAGGYSSNGFIASQLSAQSETNLSTVPGSTGSQTIAELLGNNHHLFPPWILVLISARRQSRNITKLFAGFRKITLDDLRKAPVVRDVQHYILARLDRDEAVRQHLSRETAEMLNHLHIKSNGCFLYLEKVLDGVGENFINIREIKDIPGTLNGLYLYLCQRLFTRKQFHKVLPLANAVLASFHPLTETELRDVVQMKNVKITEDDFQRRFGLLKRVLVRNAKPSGQNVESPEEREEDLEEGEESTVILFHHSFAEWLVDVKHCTQKYLCSPADGHAMLAVWLSARAADLCDEEVHELAYHLTRMTHPESWRHQDSVRWLMTTESPIRDCLLDLVPKDAKVVRLLRDAGARLDDNDMLPSAFDRLHHDAEEDEYGNLEKTLEESQIFEDEEPRPVNGEPEDEFDGPGSLADLDGIDLTAVDANQRTLLHCAANEGNSKLVAALLARDLDVMAIDKDGQTPLSLAARQGHTNVVVALLKAGADCNHADADGWSPLRAAAWAGHLAVVESLLKYGAAVDSVDSDNRTALRAAAWGGHDDIVRRLVAAGADINQEDHEGRTALIAAAYMGHCDIVEFLLDSGANVNHEDSDGRTALSVAALCVPANEGYARVVHTLLEKGAKVDHEDKDGMTPLLVAAFEGHKGVCELLLAAGADGDHTEKAGSRSALWLAASMGHGPVVKLLLDHNCYVDGIDAEGRTVLSVAAAQGSPEVVSLLLERGLDEMHKDNSGWAPLHYASFEGHAEVSLQLVDAGARIDEMDKEGRTALILAAQEGHVPVVSAICSRNASLELRSHDGRTALRTAALNGHRDIVQFLLSKGANINYIDPDGRSTLYVLSVDNRLAMAEYLIARGADLEARDAEGRTSLHVAAWQGHLDMVEVLVKHGARVNATDADRRTALQSAAWQGHAAVVKFLLENGAEVDHACNQGATALSICAQEGHLESIKLLLEHGADPAHSDTCGRSALRMAIKGGHVEAAKLLEERLGPLADAASKGNNPPSRNSSSSPSVNSSLPEISAAKPPAAVASGRPSESANTKTPPRRPVEPDESPDSTCEMPNHQRRSRLSLANTESSGGKSSSNLTGSCSTNQSHDRTSLSGNELSFTQQLQQQFTGRHHSRNKSSTSNKAAALSPLSEPRSPIYATPPITPSPPDLTPVRGPLSPNTQESLVTKSSHNYPYNNNRHYNGHDNHRNGGGVSNGRSGGLTPISFSQNDHMRIILGKPQAKPKKNGLLASGGSGNGVGNKSSSGYNFKAVSGLKNFAGGLWGSRLKSHQNGFGLNKKETPL